MYVFKLEPRADILIIVGTCPRITINGSCMHSIPNDAEGQEKAMAVIAVSCMLTNIDRSKIMRRHGLCNVCAVSSQYQCMAKVDEM